MAILIDLLLIGIIALFVLIGYKQGLVKSAIKILSFFIAVIISLILYKPISNTIIVHTSLDDNIKNIIVENVKIEEKKEEDSNVVKDNLSNKIIVGANNTIEEAANSFAVKIIELGVILLLYLITRLVLRFISALTDLITNLPILKQINKTGGIIYGFLKGIFIIYAILGIIYLISPIISKNAFDIIDNTIIAKEIYNNNILLTLIF